MNQRNKANRSKTDSGRARLRKGREPQPKSLFDRANLLLFGLYTLFWLLASFISFYGLSPAGPQVQPDQVSRMRIAAEIEFSYVSRIETDRMLESVRQRVPPVFRLDLAPYRAFRNQSLRLIEDLGTFAAVPANLPDDAARLRAAEVQSFLNEYPAGNPFNLRAEDLATLHNQLGPERSLAVISEALIILNEIYRRGIYQPDAAFDPTANDRLTLFTVEDELGNVQDVQILSEQEALRTLRIQLAALDVPRDSGAALFRVLRAGLQPNLEFDPQRTRERVERAQMSVEPVVIQVAAGATIVEPDSRVSALQYEQLEAYRRALRQSEDRALGFSPLFYEQSLLAVLIVLGAFLFLKSSRQRVRNQPHMLMLCGGMILFNLLLIRGVIELGDRVMAENSPMFLQLVPYLTPVLIGPIALTILVGIGPGILAAALVSIFNCMMQGNSLSLLLMSQLAILVAIYFCRNLQLRASLVRAGLFSGLAMATVVLLFAVRDNVDLVTTFYRFAAAVLTGLFSGIIIVGILPILEQLFKYTTDITLLELTDFNHRLLRKMQIEAPGSYHHSLMVANLAENAAAAIGANTLVCRVCALFHDIGKMVKPEYFAENQRSGNNPHLERNPSMSALVIKSHVKEGVEMAREYKLPKIIIDVIQQHHGTSLIQYFYYKAIEQQKSQQDRVVESIYPNAPRIELDKVNEATYRYEGPVPQFTESALIMLADGVEAASRSLRKVTPQSVEELVEKIFMDRLRDGQLDGTPITFRQLQKVRDSFVFTILNMLHARVEYPKGENADDADSNRMRRPTVETPPPFPPEPRR
jgi:putative nucleotidyltransferase with HDIG domain